MLLQRWNYFTGLICRIIQKKKKKPGGTVIEFKRKQKSRIPHYSGSGITSITEYFSRILCLGPVFLPKPLL